MKERKQPITPEEYAKIKNNVLIIMTRHIGPTRGIGMGELYARATGRDWKNRINDTRVIRLAITDLRRAGSAICSSVSNGYYLAQTESDMTGYLESLHRVALKKLSLEAGLRRMTLPDLLGQMALDMGYCGGEK
jgi:hypothetical protein